MNKKTFGKRLKEIRKNRNLTQRNLADLIYTEESHISALECGKYFPTYETLGKLTKALNVELHELFFFLHYRDDEFLKSENLKMIEKATAEQQKSIYHFLSSFLA